MTDIDNRKSEEELDKKAEEVLNEPIPDEATIKEQEEEDAAKKKEEEEQEPNEGQEEDQEEEKVTTIANDVDYEKKFKASTREALTLKFKNTQLTEKIDEAATLPEPKEEDMVAYAAKKGADWNSLDGFAKNVLKDSYLNSKRFELIHEASQSGKELDIWEKKIDDYIGSTEVAAKYPVLSEYEVDFKSFCMKQSRRGMDLEDLVASFFYYREKEVPKTKKKKSMLLEGSGGAAPTKPQGMTADKARAVRLRDQKEYQRLVREGKIDMDLLEAD